MRNVFKALCGFVACFAMPAVAEIRNATQTFSAICKGDLATGFYFEGTEWHPAKFKPSTYVVTKLDPAANKKECTPYFNSHRSAEISFVPEVLNYKQGFGYGCYRVKMLGGLKSGPFAEECSETWRGSEGNAVLKHVRCTEGLLPFEFDFDGAFTSTSTYSAFDSDDGDSTPKDSIFIVMGNCAQTN